MEISEKIEIAEKLSERMNLMANQAANLAAAFTEVERRRLIGVGIAQQITETDEQLRQLASIRRELRETGMANSEQLFALTTEIEDSLSFLRQPVDAPAVTVEKVAALAKSKRIKEAAHGTVAPETEKESGKEVEAAVVPDGAAEPVKHPCHICEDVFYQHLDLIKHLRAEHKLGLQESLDAANGTIPAPIRSLCADCLGGCDPFESPASASVTTCGDHQTDADADQIKWRDSTCEEWRACLFTAKCFGPSNEENPTCFKEDEIRRRGEASLDAEKRSTCQHPRKNQHAKQDGTITCTACGTVLKTAEEFKDALSEAREKRQALIAERQGKTAPIDDSATPPCMNRDCGYADLASPKNCTANLPLRQRRTTDRCPGYVSGPVPVSNGELPEFCHNDDCHAWNDGEPNGCESHEHVWECEDAKGAPVLGEFEEKENSAQSFRDQHDAIVRAAIASGDDINEHGVYLNPEIITIPIPPKTKHTAEIRIATTSDGQYCYGYDLKYPENGTCGAPSISGPFFASREDAVLAALAFLTTRWPNKKIPGRKVALECVNAYYMQTVKQAAAALPVFRCLNIECEFNNFDVPDSCNEPDRKGRPVDNCCDYSSIPVAPKEQPKQEVAQPVDESPAQASEVAKCRNNDCDYFDNFMPDYCTKLALGEPVPVTDCKDYQAMWPQDREQPKPYAPEDCDDCGNRGILDGTDDYCNCPHGVSARKADQAELERRKERKAALAIDKDRACCMPPDRDWVEVDGTRILYCRVCNLIHRMTRNGGVDVPSEIGSRFNPLQGKEEPQSLSLRDRMKTAQTSVSGGGQPV